MKITKVRLGRISVPLRTPFKTALRSVNSVEDVIVEIHTDCGAVGYGEARNYYYCLIADATACCQQGLEFLWDGHAFPDDYPEPGTEIIIEGVFDTYLEDGYEYMQLINASMEPV